MGQSLVSGLGWGLALASSMVALGGWQAPPARAQRGLADQINPPGGVDYNVSDGTSVYQQPIEAGVTGGLNGILFYAIGSPGTRTNVRVRLGDAWNTGPAVFSGTLEKPGSGPEEVFLDLSAAGIRLDAGDVFVVELEGSGGPLLALRGRDDGAYPRDLCISEVCPFFGGGWSLSFTTYMRPCDGDGEIDAGEQCDDGNATAGDGCSASCRLEYCGNATVDPGEACDDGNRVDGDGCAADCRSDEGCGNDVVDGAVGEQCDDGNTDGGDGCSATCRLEVCGNGVVDPGEVCDDGNVMGGDGCASDCFSDETCGNGVVDVAAGEACDDGNTADGDGCSAACALPSCGDGIVDPGEACDDGNTAAGDGCGATCRSDESCGNGVVDGAAGEQCDDGNTAAGDGCGATCRLEVCGNGIVDPDEVCDDGNVMGGDGCASDCFSDETCGNGVVDAAAGEACDDGNTADGDGCQRGCALPSCGDGVVDAGEACDDGNTDDGDGCNATCTSDESCGNGVVDRAAGELCDEGDENGMEGPCGADCALVRVLPDAGAPAAPDGGAQADAGTAGPAEDGGCGCRVPGAAGGSSAAPGLVLLLLGLVVRRRRASGAGGR
jgi:MYXO-CTERM domain-containing protein